MARTPLGHLLSHALAALKCTYPCYKEWFKGQLGVVGLIAGCSVQVAVFYIAEQWD